jgi:hypothetical protein
MSLCFARWTADALNPRVSDICANFTCRITDKQPTRRTVISFGCQNICPTHNQSIEFQQPIAVRGPGLFGISEMSTGRNSSCGARLLRRATTLCRRQHKERRRPPQQQQRVVCRSRIREKKWMSHGSKVNRLSWAYTLTTGLNGVCRTSCIPNELGPLKDAPGAYVSCVGTLETQNANITQRHLHRLTIHFAKPKRKRVDCSKNEFFFLHWRLFFKAITRILLQKCHAEKL